MHQTAAAGTEVLGAEFNVIKTWVELHHSEVLQVHRSDEGAALMYGDRSTSGLLN
jgi:hypothetical protein